MLVTTAAPVPPSVVSLLDEIYTDENVKDALGEAIMFASIQTLEGFVPGDSAPSYVGTRAFQEIVTRATGRLRSYGYYPVDVSNQRHLVNNHRYSEPVTLIPSGARKVNGGFKVARKGYMTLYMLNGYGQGLLFGEDGESLNNSPFWVLHEIIKPQGRLKIYLARPTRLLKNGTFLEATEFRTIFDDVIPELMSGSAASTEIAITETILPQGTEIDVSFIEVNEP